MSGRAWWVLCPTDGKAHPLAVEGPGDDLVTQCGQSLPLGVVQHDRLPSRHFCRDCFRAYLLPPDPPVFARKTPAGRGWSDAPESAPGGRPVPKDLPAPSIGSPVGKGHGVGRHPATVELPCWARCPVDQQLHLLSAAEVTVAAAAGVRFDDEIQPASIRPHLVRVIEGDGDCGGR